MGLTSSPAPSGGGGTPIALPLQAWVESTGNNGTGEVGNPALPYETMSAAYTAGARIFHLGNGTFAGLSLSGNIDIGYTGHGRAKTTITQITSTNGGNVVVQDLGVHSAKVGEIKASGSNGASGSPGTSAGTITVTNVYADNITAYGGNGGDGNGLQDGQAAGNGGDVVIHGRVLVPNSINTSGGFGGAAGNDGEGGTTNGGAGGAGGSLSGTGTLTAPVTTTGGGGMSGLNGGMDGSSGSAGNITLDELTSSGVLMEAGGDTGTPGTLTLKRGYIDALNIGGSVPNNGTIAGACIIVPTITSGAPTVTALLSHIGGVPYVS